MKTSITAFFRKMIFHEEPIHPIDRRLAKEWIKRRLARVFPELRNNPVALDQAYRDLSLSARPGRGGGEPDTVFEVHLPGKL